MNGSGATSAAPAGPAPAPGGRLVALDGLRGVAVLLVVALHCYAAVPGPTGVWLHDALQRLGSLFFCGVDLFFVLSGFFIGGILLDHRDAPRLLPVFYLRRAVRILPVYALLLLSFYLCRQIPLLTVPHGGAYFASSVPEWTYFAFVQNIFMAAHRDPGAFWLGPTWSLAVEEQFYLLVPLLVIRTTSARLAQLCAGGLLLGSALRLAVVLGGEEGQPAVFLLPTHADGLLCGLLCALAIRDPRFPAVMAAWRRRLRWLLLAGIAGFAVLAWQRFTPASPAILLFGFPALSAFFGATVLYVVAFPGSRLARALSVRSLVAAGLGSYFIYLFHAPVWFTVHALMRAGPPLHFDAAGFAATGLALLATFGLAWVSWRWLEAPLLRRARRISYR